MKMYLFPNSICFYLFFKDDYLSTILTFSNIKFSCTCLARKNQEDKKILDWLGVFYSTIFSFSFFFLIQITIYSKLLR